MKHVWLVEIYSDSENKWYPLFKPPQLTRKEARETLVKEQIADNKWALNFKYRATKYISTR